LLNDGKTQSKIADFLGCSLNKVSYWRLKGDPDYLEILIDKRMKRNHKKATNKYIKILLKTIEKYPHKLGDNFGRWTAQRLATYLKKSTGIKLSTGQVRRILSKDSGLRLGNKRRHK
jgi:transposase